MHAVRAAATLAVVCLLGFSVAPALAGTPEAGGAGGSTGSLAPLPSAPQQGDGAPAPGFLQTSVDPDAVVMRAAVGADGTAEWTVEYRVRLDDDNATEAFESVQSDVRTNSTAFAERFADGMRRTVWSAENATGREMALRNVSVTAERQTLGQEYGVVTYEFTWTNVAATDGDRIRAGDSLSELFLDGETALVFAYPDGYAVETIRPRPTENRTDAVVWRGPVDFAPDEPRLVVAPDGGSSASALPLVAGVVVVLVVAAGGWALARRRRTGDGTPGDAAAGGATATAGAAAGGGDAGATAEASDATAAEGTGGGTADSGAAGATEPPEELLSNEERVIRLLNESGGRIKQQQIAAEFDWTAAKTSQVVGNLREDDAVETFRIGRENVVTLPEESDLIDSDS